MGLLYHYKMIPVGHPVLPLRGRCGRPRPIVGVTIIGASGGRLTDAVLDTAADDTVFPEVLGAYIGADLANAPAGQAAGVGLAGVPLRYAEVTLRLSDGCEFREWRAWVGFTPVRLDRPLLGFAGCLQFFTATYHGDREEVELSVNSLYPGT
jgi:hypothetical protein